MRVLIVHNEYRRPGGEDEVVAREAELLRSYGHRVTLYIRQNSKIEGLSWPQKAVLPLRAVWSADSYRDVAGLIRDERPDVAHFHNTFAMVSPAAYYACRRLRVPVVQTLHNPRLLCPAATSWRKGMFCNRCDGHTTKWPGIVLGCYRNSRIQTAGVATVIAAHSLAGTWRNCVDCYIVPSEYYRTRFIGAGFDASRVVRKPHFVAPDPGERAAARGEYALYIGRLDREKGCATLMEAWRRMSGVPLVIRGEGELTDAFQEGIRRGDLKDVSLAPRLSRSELMDLLKKARFLVWPSEGAYETFGLVAVEAFACGVPVVAAGGGVNAEIVADGRTGVHFRPGDAADLARKAQWAWRSPDRLTKMGREARQVFVEKYSSAKNYSMLMEIYRRVERKPVASTELCQSV